MDEATRAEANRKRALAYHHAHKHLPEYIAKRKKYVKERLARERRAREKNNAKNSS